MIQVSRQPPGHEPMGQGTDRRLPKNESQGSQLSCRVHGEFANWLASSGGSLAITTYTSGKLVLVSSTGGKIRYRQRRLAKPMGLALEDGRLAIVTQKSILQFQNSRSATAPQKKNLQKTSSDATFTLQREFVTGKLNAHDVAFGRRGIYFANTRFNCVARVSKEKKYLRVWRPSFLEGLVTRDSCHLNGIGMLVGRPAMATAFCETGHLDGWREEDRFTKGVLIDVREDRVVARGLCMPHSPRLHQGRWWLCNSGHGTLMEFDPRSGECQEICSLPGFTRGLSLVDDFALVGLSKIRREHVLDAPPVRERHTQLYAGVALVDLVEGRHLGSLEFVRGGREVFDVAFLPGIRRPNVVTP